jgi:hypothetical protein
MLHTVEVELVLGTVLLATLEEFLLRGVTRLRVVLRLFVLGTLTSRMWTDADLASRCSTTLLIASRIRRAFSAPLDILASIRHNTD